MNDLSPSSYTEQYLGLFAEQLGDPRTIELAVNPDGSVWIECAGDNAMRRVEGLDVPASRAEEMARSVVGDAHQRISEDCPLISGKIGYCGRPLRIQVTASPAIEAGAAFSIRTFSADAAVVHPEWLFGEAVCLDELRAERMAKIVEISKTSLEDALHEVIRNRLNVLISGGTSSGKTTLARAMLTAVSTDERLITIEDALELLPSQPNVVSLISERRPDSARSAAKLLEATLRMRPDRIVLGELRGSETLTYLEAINTGHGGSVSTVHAETARLAIDRLAIMVMQAGTPLNFAEVSRYIRRSIDVIVQLARADGRRGVTELWFPALDGGPTGEPAA